MSDIRKVLGTFIEADLSFLQTKLRKVARILVSLNIRTNLRDHINLNWGPKIRKQLLDYEGIPFRCHKFHETRHFPKNFLWFLSSTTSRKKWTTKESRVSRPKEHALEQGMVCD